MPYPWRESANMNPPATKLLVCDRRFLQDEVSAPAHEHLPALSLAEEETG